MASLLDEQDDWQDMPVIAPLQTSLDDEDKKMYHWTAPASSLPSDGGKGSTSSRMSSNATGKVIDAEQVGGAGAGGRTWREKNKLDEMDYTRLELDDDPDEDEVSMRTQYLFNEQKDMTPLAQMQATKTLLTEGQRIAYVGLCRLVAREMAQSLRIAARGAKELEPAMESTQIWANKIMGRLYRHMEVDVDEQRMIEQLAEHGVTPEDLVPSLVATYVVDNPEYDVDNAGEAEEPTSVPLSTASSTSSQEDRLRREADERRRMAIEKQWESERLQEAEVTANEMRKIEEKVRMMELADQASNPSFSPRLPDKDDSEDGIDSNPFTATPAPTTAASTSPPRSSVHRIVVQSPRLPDPSLDDDDDGGDIGTASSPVKTSAHAAVEPSSPTTPRRKTVPLDETSPITPRNQHQTLPSLPTSPTPAASEESNLFTPLPSSLPGVSTTLTASDKTITLDIRWTILCDLFLSLIADSVYDSRSRVLLGRIAEKLGLDWLDVVRFERRLTEALEIQEGVQQKEHSEILEDKRMQGKRQRYLMMGLATLGGGLVIGLSAGLLAPVIGAGLGAAFTTIGVTGTTGFLAGAGGAAVVTSGGIMSGSYIGGKAMGKRTRHVTTFEFQPLHNNKRVNFFIAVPGFMSGPLDDVRLPFSTIDPVMGDLFAVLWEPEMMGDTGNALKILTSEVLTTVGQQVLAATVMTALLSALQWPMMLTKLGYLIDNPWSNALDRSRQAGAVLADILMNRHMGVRPVSLIGFSLGARVIFYALVELAKAEAFGVVQEVYLFGTTVTASKKIWRQVRGVVSGRFVNAYAMNDWVLGYLFRATSGGLNTVAGLRPIDHVPDLENVDITDILVGHMSYRTLMPTLLAHVGFKVTADHFDEPEDLDAPDREVVSKEEEALRLEKKERANMSVFEKMKRSKSSSGSSNGASASQPATPHLGEGDDDEDDLPPRLASSSQDSLSSPLASSSDDLHHNAAIPLVSDTHESSSAMQSRESVDLPTEGFDIEKLRREVAQFPSEENDDDDPAFIPVDITPTEQLWARTTTAPDAATDSDNAWSASSHVDPFSSPDDAAHHAASLNNASSTSPASPTYNFENSNGGLSWTDAAVPKAAFDDDDDDDDGLAPDPPSSSFAWSNDSAKGSIGADNPW